MYFLGLKDITPAVALSTASLVEPVLQREDIEGVRVCD